MPDPARGVPAFDAMNEALVVPALGGKARAHAVVGEQCRDSREERDEHRAEGGADTRVRPVEGVARVIRDLGWLNCQVPELAAVGPIWLPPNRISPLLVAVACGHGPGIADALDASATRTTSMRQMAHASLTAAMPILP